jgi:MFS family permease
MSITMMIPVLPRWMMFVEGLSSQETGIAMGAFALGMFLPGAFCSFLVQHYRRNQVCVLFMLLLSLTLLPPVYLHPMDFRLVVLMRLAQGATYGLAMMVLMSTLVIDTCESYQRTEANHSSTWFGRFALALGPVAGLMLLEQFTFDTVLFVSACCCLVAVALVLMVHIPFRVPNDHLSLFSLDRFLLLSSWPLFLNLFLVMVATGLLFALPHDVTFWGMMMVGFLLALLAQRFIFPDAELKSEVVSGLVLLIASLLIMLFKPTSVLCSPLLALAIGIVGSRFLLFFIKLSFHCQRGTAQSTFFLTWESGLAIGIGLGYAIFEGDTSGLLITSLVLIIVSLLLYVGLIHQWFICHKNR